LPSKAWVFPSVGFFFDPGTVVDPGNFFSKLILISPPPKNFFSGHPFLEVHLCSCPLGQTTFLILVCLMLLVTETENSSMNGFRSLVAKGGNPTRNCISFVRYSYFPAHHPHEPKRTNPIFPVCLRQGSMEQSGFLFTLTARNPPPLFLPPPPVFMRTNSAHHPSWFYVKFLPPTAPPNPPPVLIFIVLTQHPGFATCKNLKLRGSVGGFTPQCRQPLFRYYSCRATFGMLSYFRSPPTYPPARLPVQSDHVPRKVPEKSRLPGGFHCPFPFRWFSNFLQGVLRVPRRVLLSHRLSRLGSPPLPFFHLCFLFIKQIFPRF